MHGVPQRVLELLRLTGLQAVFGVIDEIAPLSPEAPLELLELEEQAAGRRATASGRSRIDQAKGLVMATRGCDAETAWQMLFRTSREQDVQVHDLADALVRVAAGRDTGQSGDAMMIAVQVVMGVQPGPIEELTPSPRSEAREVR